MDKIKVLIVDDCPIVRDGLRSILKAFPDINVVGEAVNGRQAIATIKKLHPHVVLVDAQMPDLDGVETTRRIKSRWPNIKVLFLTVHSSYIEAALAAGADSHMMKDCTAQELVAAIRRVFGANLRRCA